MNIEIDLTNLPHVTNKKFYRLYNDSSRYLVLMGGGGSGKSVFAAQKIIFRMLNESDHRILVLRKVKDTLRESVFAELKGIIDAWGMNDLFHIPKGSTSNLYIKCKNGNEILFAGLDDVEKLKSIHKITSIWIEEASELTPEDFRQLDIRLRHKTKHYKQIILSFNPISVTHWLKIEFFDRIKPNATVIHSTYKDNQFLPQEAIDVMEAFKETDPYYYMVYALGEWGVIGKTIFPAQIVNERINQLRERKFKRGYFTFDYKEEKIIDGTIEWVDDENGYIRILEDVKPRYPYALGGDTAGDGSDNFTGHILDNLTGNQVAVFCNQLDEDLYTRQMYCLGKYYNYALIGLETNFSTFPIKELERLGYKRQYLREVTDTYTGKVMQRYGFRTDKATRPLIIANLVKIVREHSELINDIDTLNEMLTFVRNERGKPEAQEGKNDDLIMGLAISHHIRSQQEMTIAEEIIEKHELPWMFKTPEPEGGYIDW